MNLLGDRRQVIHAIGQGIASLAYRSPLCDYVRMRIRAIAPLITGAAVFAAVAPSVGKPTESQTFFENALAGDAKVTPAIKNALASDAAIIDPASGFTDVTGDGRPDALVFVTTGGAGGRIALYVFSTHGQTGTSNTDLKAVYRSQSLYNASIKLAGTTITISEPKYAKGNDIGSPSRTTERDYAWDGKTFTKRATRILSN
jgi:hypothetical protein